MAGWLAVSDASRYYMSCQFDLGRHTPRNSRSVCLEELLTGRRQAGAGLSAVRRWRLWLQAGILPCLSRANLFCRFTNKVVTLVNNQIISPYGGSNRGSGTQQTSSACMTTTTSQPLKPKRLHHKQSIKHILK